VRGEQLLMHLEPDIEADGLVIQWFDHRDLSDTAAST